jgi:hypothetical protein
MSRARSSTFFAVVCTGMLLSACGSVFTTTEFADTAGVTHASCSNNAGAYALPIRKLTAKVETTVGATPRRYQLTVEQTTKAYPDSDPRAQYCLNFSSSPFASDKIAIQAPNSLLSYIGGSFKDETLAIAEKALEAAATTISQNRLGEKDTKAQPIEIASYEFDPFNYKRMHEMNEELKQLGHCIFLDPTNDPYVPEWHAHMCSGRSASGKVMPAYHGLKIISPVPPSQQLSARGILYRPMLSHKLIVMKRNYGPYGPRWRTYETRQVSLPNAAPAFLLEVSRTAFVEKKIEVNFDNGVLKSVSVHKPGSAKALSNFVLSAAQIIVSIPVRAFVLGKTDAQNRQELIRVQAELIKTLRDYDDAVKEAQEDQPGEQADSNAPRSGAGYTLAGNAEFDRCVAAASLTHPANPQQQCLGLLVQTN